MKLKICLFFLIISLQIKAQEQKIISPVRKNSIYAELLGNGGVYSINYDRIFQISNHIKLAPRIGFSTLEKAVIVPLEVNMLLSKSKTAKNFFETGLGLTILKPLNGFSGEILTINGYDYSTQNKSVSTPFVIRAGFRHQKPTGGFMYRTGLLLFTGEDAILTLGIGLGYTF